MYRLWLEAVSLRIVLVITVVKLVAVNSIRVFESLAIHVDVLIHISADAGHVGAVEASVPVDQGLRLERAKEHSIHLPVRNNAMDCIFSASSSIHYIILFYLC